ncbi:MAG: sigma-70 family RNA polymerase sigma factor [Clostridia bacterium]|nr:sigma-70 family RNA polymerase sigma factor [Clostridia bacterium]
MMKAFDYLDSIRAMEIRIQLKARQAQHLRDTMSNITAPMDKEQVSHTKNVSAMQDAMAMVLDLEEEISQLKNMLMKRRKEIMTILDQMKPEYADVLSGRFIEGKSTKELGNIMFLSMRSIERRLNEALDAFQLMLNDLIEHGDKPWPPPRITP